MIKELYHGSNKIIGKPTFGLGKAYNDYGLGFYCTDSLHMAKEWAVDENRDGYVNCYELDCDNLSILDLNGSEFCILHWLTILLENRDFDLPAGLALESKEYLRQNFLIDYNSYDVIIGYRADDSYFSFAQDFINGSISFRQLNNAMHLGGLGQQFVLKSETAFDKIMDRGFDFASSNEWYSKKRLRDTMARREYFNVERNRHKPGDIYITHIMDEEMKSDDSRLR